MTWFGADPGGAGKFGVALLHSGGSFETGVVDCADGAIEWLTKTGASVDAAGIDAPLWWSSGAGADRHADRWLRRRYGDKTLGATVLSPNSLRGAALVQGAMLATLLRKRFPFASITECHPKALLKVWGIDPSDRDLGPSLIMICKRFDLVAQSLGSEHERDSLLAAIAAREGSAGRWTHDLTRQRSDSEQEPTSLPWGPVSYWWPET